MEKFILNSSALSSYLSPCKLVFVEDTCAAVYSRNDRGYINRDRLLFGIGIIAV